MHEIFRLTLLRVCKGVEKGPKEVRGEGRLAFYVPANNYFCIGHSATPKPKERDFKKRPKLRQQS